jgi:branched-chain amino acid transport system permease protein
MARLEISAVSLRFGGVRALQQVSFAVPDKALCAIIGPNGAGKTSLLNCISGIYRPQSGRVLLDGEDLTPLRPHQRARRGLSCTFQNLGLFPGLTVLENLLVGRHLQLRGADRRQGPGRLPGCRLMDFFVQLTLNGLVVGGIYALVALGFVVIYKSSGILNFAQGEFLMLGAYVSLAILATARVPFPAAFALTLAFSAALGLLLERVVLRPLLGQPIISVIMVTLGLSSVLKAVVQGFWGTDTRPFPAVFPTDPVLLGPLPVSRGYLWSLGCVAVLLVLLDLFFRYTRMGLAMRATASSQQVALSMGIPVRRVVAIAWVIAAAVSAVGGMLLGALRGGADGSLAFFGLKVVPVVILGGLESVTGAIAGGLIIGVLENLSGGYLDPIAGGGVKDVAPFVALVVILMIKPHGLFGRARARRA